MPAKKTWLTSAGWMDRMAARSLGEGVPVGASIFSDNVNVPWNPPFLERRRPSRDRYSPPE